MFKNVATKLAIFAFDTTDGSPKTGDAANLTAYVSKDYGAVTVLADTSAAEMDATNAKGWYLFDLAQAETNADALLFTGKSSTASISLVGQLVFTTPANFSTASIDSNGRVDVIKLAGTTQTARDIGTSVLLSSGTGTGQLSLSSGLVTLAGVTHTGAVIPTVTTTTTATNLTNAPTSGDLTATMKTSVTTAATAATPIAASVTGAVGSVTGAVGSVTGLTASDVGAIKTVTDALPNSGALTTIQADLDNLQTRVPAALVGGRMDSNVSAIGDDTTALTAFKRAVMGNAVVTVGSGSTTTSIVSSACTPSGASLRSKAAPA